MAKREGKNVPADIVRRDIIEIRENERIGEKNCVIKEGLRHHESKRQEGPDSESDEKRMKDFPQGRVRTRVQPHWRQSRCVLKTRSMQAESGFDVIDHLFRFLLPSVNDEPAWAFWDPRPQKKNNEAERGTDEKSEPPADVGIEVGRVQNEYRCCRSQRAADPERAVDGKIDPSAIARRDHFLNRRIDCTVFAAYSCAGQHAEQTKAFQIPGKSRSGRGN